MKITETRTDDKIQLSIDGRIDTNTAPQLQQAVLSAFQKGKHLILDFSTVAYISSAGLRALLIGQKTATSKGGTMKVLHPNADVVDIFKTTGFAKFLKIEA